MGRKSEAKRGSGWKKRQPTLRNFYLIDLA